MQPRSFSTCPLSTQWENSRTQDVCALMLVVKGGSLSTLNDAIFKFLTKKQKKDQNKLEARESSANVSPVFTHCTFTVGFWENIWVNLVYRYSTFFTCYSFILAFCHVMQGQVSYNWLVWAYLLEWVPTVYTGMVKAVWGLWGLRFMGW